MANIDLSLMKQLLTDKITLSPKYKNGIEEFMAFVSVNGMDEDLMKCSCRT